MKAFPLEKLKSAGVGIMEARIEFNPYSNLPPSLRYNIGFDFEALSELGELSISLDGITLPAGTPVTLCIGAANRDPAQFIDPENLDIGRSPNRHLAFGTGIHQCAGMSLARLEGTIALSRFLKRFPNYQLGAPVRGGRVRFRGFLKVPCEVES